MMTANVKLMMMRNTFWILISQLSITVFGIAENNIINNTRDDGGLQKLRCSTGKLPLWDESSLLFPCQRGCPRTFYCEQQNSISLCCPNSTEIAKGYSAAGGSVNSEVPNGVERTKIGFQFESSKEFENSISCERYEYRESCNKTESQPQAKWYYDVQTLSCELYPFGVCKDDPIAYLALKTKEECEKKCDVAKLRSALDKLKSNSAENNKVDDVSIERTTVKPDQIEKSVTVISPASSKYAQVGQLAIEDPIVESKHIRSRPFAIEPPTDLIHLIHTPSDTHILHVQIADDGELLTGSYSTDLPTVTLSAHQTVTSDTLTIGANTTELSEEIEGSGSEELISREIEEVLNEEIILKSRRQSVKSMEDSFERFYNANKKVVVCQKTEYKLFCIKGKPSQFVYRWELLDGTCQSFPFGYCLYETNAAHPRTKEECETFCKLEEK